MMSKPTRKLLLKKELLRVLDEGHLRAVNGGNSAFGFAPSSGDKPYSLLGACSILCEPILAPEAAPL